MALPFILYNNIYETGTISATSEAEAVENVIDLRSYVRWVSSSASTQYLTVDYGSAVSCDALGIAGHNLAGAILYVQSSDTGLWAGEHITRLPSFVPGSGDIARPFQSASARYWRVALAGIPTLVPEIGVLCLGERMTFPIYPDAPLDYKTSEMVATDGISKKGHLLGVTTRYEPFTFSLNFTYIVYSWITANFDAFWTHAKKHKPFFVNINSDVWSDGRFCKFPESFKYRKTFKDAEYLDVLSLPFEGIE